MRKTFSLILKIFMMIASLFMIIASLFYLFVVPMIFVTSAHARSEVELAFAGFLLFQTFLLTIELAYSSAASVYRLERKSLFFAQLRRIVHNRIENYQKLPQPTIAPIMDMFISYLIFVYAFSVLYIFISTIDNSAFSNNQILSVVDGIYFSTITAATVGYGDIAPVSRLARIVVIIQVYVSLFYTVLIFAGAASHLRDRRSNVAADDTSSASKSQGNIL